jgi:cytochrome oxidase Cu insertion factor (SCO1/SenC/PrrC family)
MPEGRGNARLVLFLVVVVCAGPLLLAWFLLNYTDVGRDGGERTSHGQLIEPLRPLPDIALRDAAGSGPGGHLHGKWTLIYVTRGSCADRCQAALRAIRDIRLATGRNTHRVQRLLVIYGGGAQGAELPAGQLAVDGALLDGGDEGKSFRLGSEDDPFRAGRIYLSDPLGNLMMSYPEGTHPDLIIDDLKHLLRYSGIG